MATAAAQTTPWFERRSFEAWRDEFDRRGYLIFERVLSPDTVADIRAALAPQRATSRAATILRAKRPIASMR